MKSTALFLELSLAITPKLAGLLIPRLRLRGEGPSKVAAEVEAIAFRACLVCLAKVGKKGV